MFVVLQHKIYFCPKSWWPRKVLDIILQITVWVVGKKQHDKYLPFLVLNHMSKHLKKIGTCQNVIGSKLIRNSSGPFGFQCAHCTFWKSVKTSEKLINIGDLIRLLHDGPTATLPQAIFGLWALGLLTDKVILGEGYDDMRRRFYRCLWAVDL